MARKDEISPKMRALIALFDKPIQGHTPPAVTRASTTVRAASISTPAPQKPPRPASGSASGVTPPQKPPRPASVSVSGATPPRPTLRPYSEIKAEKRKEKQELALALATKKDLDNGGALWSHAISEMKGRLPSMPMRPVTAIAIPSPWAPRRVNENGEEQWGKSKLKIFRKWNQEHIVTQKQAHEEANGLRVEAHFVRAQNASSKEAHKIGQEAANERYRAGALAKTGSAAATLATMTGGADGFTSAISTSANLGAAYLQRRGENASRKAEAEMDKAIGLLTDTQRGSDVGAAMEAIRQGHSASARVSKRARNLHLLNSVVASSGMGSQYAGMPGASERILTAKGSPVADQAPSGGMWDMSRPTGFTVAEAGTDKVQDIGYQKGAEYARLTRESQKKAGSAVSRISSAFNTPFSASKERYSAKKEQQKAARQEITAYKSMRDNQTVHKDSQTQQNARVELLKGLAKGTLRPKPPGKS